MIALLINIAIAAVVLLIVYLIVKAVVNAIGLPAPTARIVDLIFGLIALLWLLGVILGPARFYAP